MKERIPVGRLSGVTLYQTFISGAINTVSILSVFIIAELGFTKSQIGVVGSAACIGQAFSSMIFGNILDRKNSRFLVAVCACGAAACLAVSTLAKSFVPFLLMLLFTGCWCAISTPYGVREINSWVPKKYSNLAISIRQTGVPLGTMLMSLVLPIVAESLGWRSAVYFASSVLALYGIGYYFLFVRNQGTSDKKVPAKAVTATSSDYSFLRRVDFWTLLVAGAVFMGMQYILITYLPLYLQEYCGISVVKAASFLAISQTGGIVARILLGRLSDTLFHGKCKPLILVEGLLMVLSFVGLLIMGPDSVYMAISCVCFIFGASAMGWNALHISFAKNIVPVSVCGTAVGILMSVLQVGTLVIPFVAGKLLNLGWQYKDVFYLCIVLVTIASFMIYLVKEEKK